MKSKATPMVSMASNGTAVPSYTTDHVENGRLYHSYRRGMYMYPCDEPEKDRMDIMHKVFLVARRNQWHSAPVPVSASWGGPPRILDLGCGTGIWTIDMADKYQHAEVIGIDLANIQPEKIPPNLVFHVPRDYESLWTLGSDSFDLIHLRMACGSVQNWPFLYSKIFQHLKPGQGWIEHVEIDMKPRCVDGSLPADSNIIKWYDYLADATQRAERPIAYNLDTRQKLENAGFIDIHEEVIRAPYNGWSSDPHQREIGRWYNLALTEGLEALSFGPFSRINRWDVNQNIRPFLEMVRREICNSKIHAYNNIHIWRARRPQ